jgi:valine dehydrogenase (NAD+)
MRASAQHAWGASSLAGRTVGIAGVGKVGKHLVGLLLEDGADIVVTDVNSEAVQAVVAAHPEVEVVADTDTLVHSGIDLYAPCALGGALTDEVVSVLKATVVCGAANNQLAHPGVDGLLADRGILYAPDFCVNSGGVIQVADELAGFDFARAKAKTALIYETTKRVFEAADDEGVPPEVAAERMAERRMAAGG